MGLKRNLVAIGAAIVVIGGATGGIAALASGEPTPAPSPVPAASATPMAGCAGMQGDAASSPMAAAAAYLGLSQDDLMAQRQAGTSLADIAAAQGKTVAGLEDAMVAAMSAKLDANPSLTPEQRADSLAQMRDRMDTMVNATQMGGMMGQGGMGGMGGGTMDSGGMMGQGGPMCNR